MRLKKGDEVVITSGKDKGKKGKIEAVFPQKSLVFLPGLNIFKRHVKRRDEKNPGGILSLSRPISIANVALLCPKCKKPTRLGMKLGREKERICRKCKQSI